MLKSTRRFLNPKKNQDVFWYGLASALPPAVGLVLGPLVLKKVGLENFALLGLLGYFVGLASTYSDLGGFSHLVAAFSKNSPSRVSDAVNFFYLKAILCCLVVATLCVSAWIFPREDPLFSLLAISFLGLPFSLLNIEWYFIARRRFFSLFQARATMLAIQVVLTLTWVYSSFESMLFLPLLTTISTASAFLLLLSHLPKGWFSGLIPAWKNASLQNARALAVRLFPIAATNLLAPYSLAYSMPWFVMSTPDKELQGTFSIAYRLIMGFSALIGPMVYFSMPILANRSLFSMRKILVLSIAATAVFWVSGILVLHAYFAISDINSDWFPHARGYFSILLLALFLMCVRAPLVGKLFMAHRYREYFLFHFFACLPIVMLSLVSKTWISHKWVPWLSCLPDLLATALFIIYFYIGPGRERPSIGGSGRESEASISPAQGTIG